MPVLRRRRGRRPKIDKLLEASALESMIAANSGGAAGLTGSLASAGLSGGLNMLWPMAGMPGFEQCLSFLADANAAERSRLLLGESGQQPVPHSDVQQTSTECEEQPPKSLAAETSVGSLDLRALLNKEGRREQTTSQPADGESGDASANNAEACSDGQPKDVDAADADVQKDSRPQDADTHGMNLTSAADSDRTPRGTGEHHSAACDDGDESSDQPLKLTAGVVDRGKDLSVSGPPSHDVSRQSAGEDEEDVTSRLRGSDDVVARWLAEHRNTFDRQGLEDEVQSEVCYR